MTAFTVRAVDGDPKHKTLTCATCGPVPNSASRFKPPTYLFAATDERGISQAKRDHICVGRVGRGGAA